MGKAKRIFVNLLFAEISFVITYLLLELVFFRFYLPYVPLNIVTHLPDLAGVLVQNTKAKFVPQDYVALLGDSYAEGVGDWLWQARGDRTKPYHSGNVIQDATGRDVVTFGREGASSAEGIVLRPAQVLAGAQCYFFPEIAPPKDIFIYYYEGNDVEDNLRFLTQVERSYGGADNASIDRYLSDQYAAFPFWKCHFYLGDTAFRMTKFLFQHHMVGVTFDPVPLRENTLVIAGEQISAPPLQGPALGRSDEDIVRSMKVLDRSLFWLRQRFPDVSATVVYLPSPATLYRFAGDTMRWSLNYRSGVEAPLTLVDSRRQLMCNLVRKAALDHGTAFLNPRPALRERAAVQAIHGPLDWFHVNEAGYRILGDQVAKRLLGQEAPDTCDGSDD